ncbi:hypothetical protein K7I13_08955 [Brucepastera parasyntrophica]|uniref:nickel/cobalt transporter n=1 Tax=Brucepastera parasyntrophica TaxID=2880008 RepID=UPI00210E1990|nr:hypothetical protein [Brucepastera parasyntrophica]ULQ58685.1 hypothetical protein K7I13_08955 [Brucepastera parasyntrophica]
MGSGPALPETEISDGEIHPDDLPNAAQPSPVRAGAPKRELVVRQAKLRENLGNFLYSWKETGSSSVFFAILGVAFLYGILHALGPGHRKTVVFSLYIARKAPVWEPAVIGLVLSLLHGGTALVLLLLLRGISGPLSGRADNIAIYMEGFTYLLLIVLACYLVIHALVDMISASHNHSGDKKKDSMSLGALLLTGIYPCPGAILVLILALTLDVVSVGAAAVLVMSVGMSIPIIAAGYLAWFGRTGLFYGLKKTRSFLGEFPRESSCLDM